MNPQAEYPNIFQGFGQKETPYEIKLKPDSKPFSICVPKWVPIPLLGKAKKKLKEILEMGVIETGDEPMKWCDSMVIANNPGTHLCRFDTVKQKCAKESASNASGEAQWWRTTRQSHFFPEIWC